MRSAVAQVPDEDFLPQFSDFTGQVLRERVLPRAVDIDSFIRFDATEGGWANKYWPEIICNAYPELKGKSFKDLLMTMVLKTLYNRVYHYADLIDFAENFSGKGMVTCHLIKRGLVGKRLDIVYKHSKAQDADFYNACTAKGSR